MVLPPAELEKFLRALRRDFDALIKTLTDVDVEQAESHDPADKRNILEAVRGGVGVHALNVAAAGGLRDGVALAAHEVRRRRGRTHARCAPPLSGGRVPGSQAVMARWPEGGEAPGRHRRTVGMRL